MPIYGALLLSLIVLFPLIFPTPSCADVKTIPKLTVSPIPKKLLTISITYRKLKEYRFGHDYYSSLNSMPLFMTFDPPNILFTLNEFKFISSFYINKLDFISGSYDLNGFRPNYPFTYRLPADPHAYTRYGGGQSPDSGQNPYGIALDNNYLYVADYARKALEIYDKARGLEPGGLPKKEIGSPAFTDHLKGVAVAGNNLYVIEGSKIAKFNLSSDASGPILSGKTVCQLPLNSPRAIAATVDPLTGKDMVYLIVSGKVQKITNFSIPFGPYLSNPELPFNNPSALAIDPITGYIYVSDTGNKQVQVFNRDGSFKGRFGTLNGPLGIAAYNNFVFVGLSIPNDPRIDDPEIVLYQISE